MLSKRLRRSLPVLLLLLAGLVHPLAPATAFSLSSTTTHHSSKGLGSAVWTWLARLFQVTWEKNGMTIDPNGQPSTPAPPLPQGLNGSMPDPKG
jgi:hypothetical protein